MEGTQAEARRVRRGRNNNKNNGKGAGRGPVGSGGPLDIPPNVEEIGNDRLRGRGAAGFTDAEADARRFPPEFVS